MKILHVGVDNFGPGGVATYVRQLIAGQKASGHAIHVAELWSKPGNLESVEHRLAGVPELVDLVGRLAPDVVHLHSQLPTYAGLGRATVLTAHEHSSHCPSGGRFLERSRQACCRPYGIPGCIVGHLWDRCGSRNPANMWEKFRITRNVPSFPGRWVAPSVYSRDMLVKRGLVKDRIHLVRNPGPAVRAPRDREPASAEFLFLGRLVSNKGCDVAIRAVAMVPGARLAILGEGPMLDELRGLVESLSATDRIEFLGWQPREVVDERLDDCTALLVPSIWPEPFGLVSLEAYARRRPVIASAVGGLADIVQDGVSGFLVPPGRPEDMAKAVSKLLADPALTDRMGRSGADDLEKRFPLKKHMDELAIVYAMALADKNRP